MAEMPLDKATLFLLSLQACVHAIRQQYSEKQPPLLIYINTIITKSERNVKMNYRKTLIACYLGFVTQAITANFAPLLFLTFHNVYNIPLGKIALISSVFFISILLMICAGESELSMAQWASAFAESALGLSKAMGDIAGPCLFAVTMGISRSLYGKYGDRLDLIKFMIGSGVLCIICYLVDSLSDIPMLGLAGCIICGFSVGIMWPGTISICSGKMPSGGTAMFALLAMAGDLGDAIGPGMVWDKNGT